MQLWLIFITFRKCCLLRLHVLAVVSKAFGTGVKLSFSVFGEQVPAVPCPFTVSAGLKLFERKRNADIL